jgi:hypothetical protein
MPGVAGAVARLSLEQIFVTACRVKAAGAVTYALCDLAALARDAGEVAASRALSEASPARFRQLGDQLGAAQAPGAFQVCIFERIAIALASATDLVLAVPGRTGQDLARDRRSSPIRRSALRRRRGFGSSRRGRWVGVGTGWPGRELAVDRTLPRLLRVGVLMTGRSG